VCWTDNMDGIRSASSAPMGGLAHRDGITVDAPFVYWADYENADAGGVVSLRKVAETVGDVRGLATGRRSDRILVGHPAWLPTRESGAKCKYSRGVATFWPGATRRQVPRVAPIEQNGSP
jgi:hypothetical protein